MLGKIIENKKSRKLGMEIDENILFENLLKKEMEKKLSIIFYFSFFMMLYSLHHFLYLLLKKYIFSTIFYTLGIVFL